jgi:hypothetical protein
MLPRISISRLLSTASTSRPNSSSILAWPRWNDCDLSLAFSDGFSFLLAGALCPHPPPRRTQRKTDEIPVEF